MPLNDQSEFINFLMEQNKSVMAQNKELTETVAELTAKIDELTKKIAELTEQKNKNSNNSSKPKCFRRQSVLCYRRLRS